MIAIGGLSSLVGLLPEAETWCAQGLRMIRHVLDRHVIGEDSGGLRRFDFVEFVDRDGAPWIQDGRVVCDPGHAMEFCGLTARFLLRAYLRGIVGEDFESLSAECRLRLPWVFLQAFENGYKPARRDLNIRVQESGVWRSWSPLWGVDVWGPVIESERI